MYKKQKTHDQAVTIAERKYKAIRSSLSEPQIICTRQRKITILRSGRQYHFMTLAVPVGCIYSNVPYWAKIGGWADIRGISVAFILERAPR